MTYNTEAEVSDIDRLEKRITRQEDLFSQRDQTIAQLLADVKGLTKSVDKILDTIESMPDAFNSACEQRLNIHKAQNCDQNHPKKEGEQKPQNINENLVRIICAAVGIIAALLGVKIGF